MGHTARIALRESATAATEAGARHSAADQKAIQQVHDGAVSLGAVCAPMEEARRPLPPARHVAALVAESGMSFGDITELIRDAIEDLYPGQVSIWVRDVYPDTVVYAIYPDDDTDALYRIAYTLSDGKVTLSGQPEEVEAVTTYVPETEAAVSERAFTQAQRDAMAKSGEAMPDGGYPIANVADLKNAIQSFGRGKGKAAIKKHIIARAKALNATDELPEDWNVSEAAAGPTELTGDLVPLVEKAVKTDGSAKIKIIQAGQGSSGFYPEDVLKRDAGVFAAGTHIYLDHPSASDETNRPERSVRDLAGSLTGPAVWEEHGAAGPGLYAPVKFIDSVAPHINAIAPISGMSIRASGRAGTREIDGKKVRTIEGLELAHSVDVVTRAGAGGRVVDLIESARTGAPRNPSQEGKTVTDEEARALREALEQAQNDIKDLQAEKGRMSEALLFAETRDFVSGELAQIEMPEKTRARIVAEQATKPVLTEAGKLDRDGMRTQLRAKATEELDYLKSTTGYTGVRGMGGGPAIQPIKESQASINQSMRRLGMSESAATLAATGR